MRLKSLFFCALLLFSSLIFAARLQQVSIQPQADKTVVSLKVDGSFTWKSFVLSSPDRMVIDFYQVSPPVPSHIPKLTSSLINKVRTGHPKPEILRLVFDLNEPASMQSSRTGNVVNLVLSKKNAAVSKVIPPTLKKNPVQISATNKSVVPQSEPAKAKPILVKNNPPRALRDVVVVIDAGHGGKDPGAKGPGRTLEKDVVLAMALKLKYLVDREPGMRAVLTRKGDYYIGLRERLNIARKYNGDIFVSIHADAFINQHSHGASVFALSQRGATSEAARWLAEKENYSELGGVNLSDLGDSLVRSVLIDLSQTATIGSSVQLGGRVLKQMGKMTGLHNHRVEQARFMVLKSPDTPSILVETGFISNPREEANLRNNVYQYRLSQSIFQGIKSYFWEYPPHGSRLEAMSASSRHIVKAGETLPSIAARHKTTVDSLKDLNPSYAKAPLKAGQKLIVPAPWA